MTTNEMSNGSGCGVERDRLEEGRERDRLEFIGPDRSRGGTSVTFSALGPLGDGREAREITLVMLNALVFKRPEAMATVCRWYTQLRGFDASRHAVSIVKLHDAVDAAHEEVLRSEGRVPEKRLVFEALAEHIKATFGPPAGGGRMPGPADLERWISRYSRRSAKGKMTMVGIVAAIIHEGRLFGASGSLKKTRSRVDAALRRRRNAGRRLHG